MSGRRGAGTTQGSQRHMWESRTGGRPRSELASGPGLKAARLGWALWSGVAFLGWRLWVFALGRQSLSAGLVAFGIWVLVTIAYGGKMHGAALERS